VRDGNTPHHEGKDRWKEREVRDQRGVDEDGDPERDVAIRGHDPRNPIQGPGEVHDAGQEALQERAAQRHARERNQERRERDPAEGRMAVLRKADREQNAGSGSERVTDGTRGQARSVYYALFTALGHLWRASVSPFQIGARRGARPRRIAAGNQ